MARSYSINDELFSESLEAFQQMSIGGNLVVLSALDSFSVGEGTDFGDDHSEQKGLYLYVENLLLVENLRFSTGVISTYNLSATGARPAFDTSGKNGDSPDLPNETDGPGIQGEKGDDGGNLIIYQESAEDDSPVFYIQANGGKGGAGQKGMSTTSGGNGGNGGNGASIGVLTSVYYLAIIARLQAIAGMNDPYARQQALAAFVDSGILNKSPLTNVRNIIDAARSAKTDADCLKHLDEAALVLDALASNYTSRLKTRTDVSGGDYGPYGESGRSNGSDGEHGLPGNFSPFLFYTPKDLFSQSFAASIFVHPSQCERLLNKIKLQYFILDPIEKPEGVPALLSLLVRLQARTKLFTLLHDDHPIAMYYKENEQSVGAYDSINRLRSVNSETEKYLAQLRTGHDIFGYNQQHVPLGSLAFYRGKLQESLDNFKELEENYHTYFLALANYKADTDAIRAARDKQETLRDYLNEQLPMLRNKAYATAGIIEIYQASLPALKKTVNDKIRDLRAEIDHAFDFNFDTFFQSLTSLAFAPESSLMIVDQAGQFIYDGTAKITDGQGEPVNKDYLISELKAVQADVNSLSEGFQSLNNGELEADDPGAGKLISDEAQIMDFLKGFYDKFPTAIDSLKKSFDDYIQAIIARNSQILTYNATVVLIGKDRAGLDEIENAKDTLNDQALQTLDPNLPAMSTFVSTAYYNARMPIMETLDLTARAYRFWALSDDQLLNDAYDGKMPGSIDYEALLYAQTLVIDHYEQAVENFGTNCSVFPKGSEGNGLTIRIPDDYLPAFIDAGLLVFNIPVVTQQTTATDSPFSGMANVRIVCARVWLEGASTSDHVLQVEITHTGKEKIAAPGGLVYSFEHDPVKKLFRYDLKDRSIIEDAIFAINNGQDKNADYAALGPFTQWCLTVDKVQNKDLDLSGVTGIVFEFHGTNYSFT